MVRSILFTIIIFGRCIGLSACAVSSEDKPDIVTDVMENAMEETAKGCYLEMYRAMMEKDSVGMSKILDDTFILTHMTGMRQPKVEFISAVLNGTLNYYTAKHDDIRLLATDGERASMVGKTQVEAAVFGGSRHSWHLQQEIELVRRNGQWFIAEARASLY